jgi:glucokinase-like ROK family protein
MEFYMHTQASIDHTTMREMNLALVLNTLRQEEAVSRAEIARITGLQKATVSSLTKELLDRDYVVDLGIKPSNNQVGRPSNRLSLNPNAGYIIGSEIGVDYIIVIATDFAANIVEQYQESTLGSMNSLEKILDRTIELIQETLKKLEKRGRPIFGIGLGVPGLVNSHTGTLLFAPNLGWKDIPLCQIMSDAFNIPVYVDNEANYAALGETYFGAGLSSNYVLYIVSGIGLGGGIVLNGQLLTGWAGFSGEFGHMTVDSGGLRCNCGNYGCWETVASQKAVFRRIREAITTGNQSTLMETTGADLNKLTIDMVVDAAKSGDQVALRSFEETGFWLGLGIANLINALNPKRIVFGGILSQAHEILLPIIEDVVEQRALQWSRENTEIVVAKYGSYSCVIGGVATVYHKVLNQPSEWMAISSK